MKSYGKRSVLCNERKLNWRRPSAGMVHLNMHFAVLVMCWPCATTVDVIVSFSLWLDCSRGKNSTFVPKTGLARVAYVPPHEC